MRHQFFKQSGMTKLFQTQFGVESYGFKESMLVYDYSDDEEDMLRQLEEEEEAKKKPEAKEKPSGEEDIKQIQGGTLARIGIVDDSFTRDSERHRELLDRYLQDMPVDMDPAKIKKVQEDIEGEFAEKKVLFEGLKKEISAFAGAGGRTGMGIKKLEDDIGSAFFRVVPVLNLDIMKDKKSDISWIKPEHIYEVMRSELYNTLKRNAREGEKFDIKTINNLARKLSEFVPKFVENQRNAIAGISKLKETIVGISENIRRRETEKRLIENAERYLGFPLKEGVMLQGLDTKWVRSEKTGEDEFKRRRIKWRVMTPEISKTVRKEGEAKVILQNLIVKLRAEPGGEVISEPLNNMREFMYVHDITPVVQNKIDLYDKVDYLTKMGITLKPGDELEYDSFVRDEKTQEIKSQANKVKILSIDNKEVTLDKEILYKAMWDTMGPEGHVYKSKMTLGEFSRWLNIKHAMPTVSNSELEQKLVEHYKYLNETYKRNKNCHRQIIPQKGEIIYAEAPGAPMYQITNVQPDLIEISYGPSKKHFTNTQFVRWIYENDLEPFDPVLQAERAKTYLKFSDRKAADVLKDSKDMIEMFKDKGIWRNSFEELKKMRAKNLIPKKDNQNVKTIEPLDAHQHSYSALGEFWRETSFLSLDDIFKIFKNYKEFYHHHWERKQKERYSTVGAGMPFFGSDFERLKQEAESAEIEHLKKTMKEWSPPQIYDALFEAHTKDQLKACIEILCEKGKFRWDDPKIWEKINHFNGPHLQIPIPQPPGIDPYQPYAKGTGMFFSGRDVAGKTGFDFLPEAIDGLWGESTYTGWKRGNDNTLDEGCSKAYNKAREVEADPRGTGGVGRELAILLEKHMNDIYIEASDYEGMLRYIIEMGKSGGEEKMYYLLMGLTVKNKKGRTIMAWDRLSYFIDKYSNAFPALDYFGDSGLKRLPGTGELYDGAFRKSHFEYLTKDWAQKARTERKYSPPADVTSFLFNEALTADKTQLRIEKSLSMAADKIDHDDFPFFGPALNDNAIQNLCSQRGTGTQKISTQSYKNIYVGFAPRINALIEKFEKEKEAKEQGQPAFPQAYYGKLTSTLTSFMRFDSIINSRYLRDKSYFNLSRHDLNSTFSWDSTNKLSKYKEDLQRVLKDIITAYNPPDRYKKFDIAFEEVPPTAENKEKQTQIEEAVAMFGKEFENMVAQDQGAKMIEVIKKHKFVQPKPGQTPQERLKNRLQVYMSDKESGQSTQQSDAESAAA